MFHCKIKFHAYKDDFYGVWLFLFVLRFVPVDVEVAIEVSAVVEVVVDSRETKK